MASNSDSSGKGLQKPGPDASKKPTAVIDLKATEVDIKNPKSEASPASSVAEAAAQAAASSKSGEAVAGVSGTGSAAATPSGTGGKAGDAGKPDPARPESASSAGENAGPKSGNAPSAKPQTVSVPLPPKSAGGGLRGAATHLVAGLAGGLLALIGADSLLPHLRSDATRAPSAAAQLLDQRIKALESAATSRQGSAELAQRLAAAEERAAQAERSVRQVAEQQVALAGETKSLSERVGQPSDGAGVAEDRVAKLEEMFSTLSQAAANDTQRGRIPQLATIVAKLTDLESSLATQVAQLRKGVTAEVDSRLSQSTEAAQAARAGTQRLDRELAGVKNETAQISGRIYGVKAQTDKLEVALQRLGEQTVALRSDLSRELAQAAKSTEVSTAISPLASKLASLEQNVQGVVRSEDERRANVERIVTALELGNLKRTIDRGAAFGTELAEVRRVAGPKVDLTILERYKDRGVSTIAELERELRPLTFRIIEADQQPADAHWTDRLLASAKSVVRVRKVEQGAEESGIEASVSRMERALKGNRLGDVLAEAGKLSERAKAPAKSWLDKVEARAAVDKAIAAVEQELKASLGAASQAGKKG